MISLFVPHLRNTKPRVNGCGTKQQKKETFILVLMKGSFFIYFPRFFSKNSRWYNTREETFVTETEAKAADYKDLGSGKPLIKTKEPSYFFKMSKYHQQLVDHITNNPTFIQPEVLSFLKNSLFFYYFLFGLAFRFFFLVDFFPVFYPFPSSFIHET